MRSPHARYPIWAAAGEDAARPGRSSASDTATLQFCRSAATECRGWPISALRRRTGSSAVGAGQSLLPQWRSRGQCPVRDAPVAGEPSAFPPTPGSIIPPGAGHSRYARARWRWSSGWWFFFRDGEPPPRWRRIPSGRRRDWRGPVGPLQSYCDIGWLRFVRSEFPECHDPPADGVCQPFRALFMVEMVAGVTASGPPKMVSELTVSTGLLSMPTVPAPFRNVVR